MDAPTPTDFTISPSEAEDIDFRHRWDGSSVTTRDIYHDETNYYVCDGGTMFFRLPSWMRGRASTASEALEYGLIINGQTGELYNRETYLWESVSQLLRSDHESESDLQASESSRY